MNLVQNKDLNRLTLFDRHLDRWRDENNLDSNEMKTRQISAKKFRKCYQKQDRSLTVSFQELSSLPSVIGQFLHLTALDLKNNRLKQIPSEIRNLTLLTDLDISNNQFTDIPFEIRHLTQLTYLDISSNRLRDIPFEIRYLTELTYLDISNNQLESINLNINSLTKLTHLFLSHNKLTKLRSIIINLYRLTHLDLSNNQFTQFPSQVTKLEFLQVIDLSDNQLVYLPIAIASLTRLTRIDLSENTFFSKLPMNLAGIKTLQYLNTENTAVHPDITRAILEECADLRENPNPSLSLKLNTWWAFSNQRNNTDKASIKDRINLFSDDQKSILSSWLLRLRETKDLEKCPQQLAKVVLSILKDMMHHNLFKENFFIQTRENLTCCGDRAAMNLNEIYTIQQVLLLPNKTSVKKKLNILTRGAKTLALRTEIGKLMNESTISQNESTEIYLYYECLLQKKHNLLTAIQHTAYGQDIGYRDEIKVDVLEERIEQTFFDHLCPLPVFKQIFNQNEVYRSKLDLIQNNFSEEMNRLSNCEALTSEQLVDQMNLFRQNYENQEKKLMRKWYNSVLQTNKRKRET